MINLLCLIFLNFERMPAHSRMQAIRGPVVFNKAFIAQFLIYFLGQFIEFPISRVLISQVLPEAKPLITF